MMVGCGPTVDSNVPNVEITPNDIRITQADRTMMFDALVGRGVVEFRWKDDNGNHKEQGDMDFWKQGEAISLRISKFGEPLMWFGGEHHSYWLFEMFDDETILTIGGDNALFSDIDIALVLLGLTSLPAGDMEVQDGIVTLTDAKGRMWTASFDPTTYRPLEIQVIDGDRQTSAVHHKGVRVEIADRHELYWPFTGGLIDIEDSRGTTSIKIVFSSLSTIVDEEPMDRVVSLPFLQKALKPSVINEEQRE